MRRQSLIRSSNSRRFGRWVSASVWALSRKSAWVRPLARTDWVTRKVTAPARTNADTERTSPSVLFAGPVAARTMIGITSDDVVRMSRPNSRWLAGSVVVRFNHTTVGWMNAAAAVE